MVRWKTCGVKLGTLLDSNAVGQNVPSGAKYTKMITNVTSTNQSLSLSETIILFGKDLITWGVASQCQATLRLKAWKHTYHVDEDTS